MRQGLAGRSGLQRRLAGGSEVGKLRGGLRRLVLDVLGNGAIRELIIGGLSICSEEKRWSAISLYCTLLYPDIMMLRQAPEELLLCLRRRH